MKGDTNCSLSLHEGILWTLSKAPTNKHTNQTLVECQYLKRLLVLKKFKLYTIKILSSFFFSIEYCVRSVLIFFSISFTIYTYIHYTYIIHAMHTWILFILTRITTNIWQMPFPPISIMIVLKNGVVQAWLFLNHNDRVAQKFDLMRPSCRHIRHWLL